MYSVDADSAQLLIGYTDIFSGEIPDVKEEISKLNMHKSISIICELIRIRYAMLEPMYFGNVECKIPFETVLKKQICDINVDSLEEMFTQPLLRKDVHIISLQMLLLLLKEIIIYGDYQTLEYSNYEISQNDYKKIIQLQLVIVENLSQKHLNEDFDLNHFLYSTYHLNYQRNVANEFLRMYYMMEKISRNKENYNDDKNEFRDYYSDFTAKYGFTPTQYSSFLFLELEIYYSKTNGLVYNSMWKDIEEIYSQMKDKELIYQVIKTLSQPVKEYFNWAIKSKEREWDFSNFFEFPFMMDNQGNYISICDTTLINAFFEKIFWLIRNCYPKEDSRSMAFFGRIFEKYIQDITENAVEGDYKYIPEFKYKQNKKSSDAYIRKETNLLVVEAKGFSVLLDCMTKNEKVEKNNNKLFVDPIIQADLCLSDIIDNESDFENVESAYIISVTMDNINAVAEYYNNIHDDIEERKVCERTKYFFNFNIEEYEMLLYLLEQKHDIFNILKDYFNNSLLKPFSNYLYENYGEIGMTNFMEKYIKRLLKK